MSLLVVTSPMKELVYDFLHDFSRFEYALKRTSFIVKNTKDVIADWDTFANSLDRNVSFQTINSSDEFKIASKYFFTNPPKKQIVDADGRLGWKECEEIPDDGKSFAELLKLVRTTRNNLFHGGKFSNGDIEGSERNKKLIKFSLVILQECLKFSPEVEREYRKEVFNIYED